MKPLMKLRSYLNSDNVIIRFPLLAKYSSKYGSIPADIKGWAEYYIFLNKKLKKPYVNQITIMPSTVCNGNCVFCAYKSFKDKKEFMPFSIFKKIVNQQYKINKSAINLTPAQGEILTDPSIIKKMEYLHKKKIDFDFYTNAILIKKYTSELSQINIKKIYIDLADINPKYDSKVFGISEDLSKKRLEDIIYFLKELEKKKSKIKVEIAFRPMRSPKMILKELENSSLFPFYKSRQIRISFLQAYDNWGGIINQKDLLGIQTLKRPMKFRKMPCIHFYHLSFLPNGDARLCGCRCLRTFNDELVIGNIKKENLKEIINAKKWKKLILDFQKGKIPEVCKKCSFYRPLFIRNKESDSKSTK